MVSVWWEERYHAANALPVCCPLIHATNDCVLAPISSSVCTKASVAKGRGPGSQDMGRLEDP